MRSNHVSILVMDLAWLDDRGIALLDEVGQPALLHKTEVLTLAARNDRQAALIGIGFDLGLGQVGQRKKNEAQLLLV